MKDKLILMLITNNPEIALKAESAGIDRVFLDFERLGKMERQWHLDTVISDHTIEDLKSVRKVIKKSDILCRINPPNPELEEEIGHVIKFGADIVMLPMFKEKEDVKRFVAAVHGKAITSLLLETPQALVRLDDILEVPGIDEIHLGLNDLNIFFGTTFMFEFLAGGLVDYVAGKVKAKGIRFGFGGIARVGSALLDPVDIIKEHVRIGSRMAILSRTFHGRAKTLQELTVNLEEEVRKLRIAEESAGRRSLREMENDRQRTVEKVREIVTRLTKQMEENRK